MKILILACCLNLISHTIAKCSRGSTESFILSSKALLTAKSYSTLPELTFVDCAQACLQDDQCQYLSYVKDRNGRSCRLIAQSSRTRDDEKTLPNPGTYFMEKVCLKGACERLFVAESVQGIEQVDRNDRILVNSSRFSCLESCLNNKGFLCRSAEFDSKTSECRLSRHDRFNSKHLFKKASASVEYFDVNCPYTQTLAAEMVPISGVAEEPTLGIVEVTGVATEECGEMCRRNTLFPCRAFLSGQVGGQLYCGLTHLNREEMGIPTHDSSARKLSDCSSSDVNFELVSGTVLNISPYTVTSDLTPQQCLQRCRNDRRCRSVAVDYRKGACQYNSETSGTHPSHKLKDDPYFNYFEKVCLRGGTRCKRDWMFERVRNRGLTIADHKKIVVEARTKEACQVACLEHKSFPCLSAEFDYQKEECRLSPYNRFSSTEKGSAAGGARYQVDYFENNCIEEPRGFCNSKLIKKQTLMLVDKISSGESIDECRQQCYDVREFVCRSASFDIQYKTCALSHHTRKSAPQETLSKSDAHELVEIATCFEVSVDCSGNVMLAQVKSNSLFKGKVYAKGKPLTCAKDIDNSLDFTLPISLDVTECGTLSEEEGKFSNVLVIQSNDHVVTAMDKAIGIHCSYDVGNKTEEIDINITDPGSSDRSRGSPSLPDLSLHIVDVKGEERETVSLGELLRVQVRMSDEDTYGIFVRNLVAKDTSGGNNLTLIDNTGCPVEAKMMREVRTIDAHSKSLEGYLEAFTFTGSSTLQLEAEVETCLHHCKPILCQIPTGRRDDDTETVSSFGRRRKRQAEDVLSTVTLTRTVSVQAHEFESVKPSLPENYAFPVTAPTPIDTKGLFSKFGSPGSTPAETTFCFDPTMFALIGGGFFLAEICGFSACLIAAFKMRKKESKSSESKRRPLSIHYGNNAE